MDPESIRASGAEQRAEPGEEQALETSPGPGGAAPGGRALRRRAGRQRTPAASAARSTDTNGASPGCQSSGRVLRDRSTRTIPAWLQSDQSDDDDEDGGEAVSELGSARRRRAAGSSRRRRPAPPAAATDNTGGEAGGDGRQDPQDPKKVTEGQAHPPSRRSQARAKATPARTTRGGAAKPMCKSEPDTDSPIVAVEAEFTEKSPVGSQARPPHCGGGKKEEVDEEDDSILEDEGSLFQDDPKDLNYQPQSQRDVEDEELSSDEDVPFRDDLNDQSYNPRDTPKPRRRPPPRPREKKEKEKAPAAEREEEPEIKVEGGESMQDVKLETELADVAQEPRKRGRRRKDDKTPRLPKRRKKPPVQYVRCEMEGCGTVLAHPRYLQHHIKYQHLLKKKYVCPHPSCGRLFRLQKQLLRHAKHHTDQRDYICEFCARAFKSSHNLAVHRMIHTGEKPLQCEICGFTCRQKASLNWHMKKHDADASYQFSCSICGKKFEKKDSVVAHKAKSHPEVLIAEALAANAGALITTTPASLLEAQGKLSAQGQQAARPEAEHGPQMSQAVQGQLTQHAGPVAQQVSQVSHQVVVLGQDQGLHAMQVPVTINLSPMEPPSPTDPLQGQLQLQMPLQFVQAATALQSQQQQPQAQQLTLHSSPMMAQHPSQLQHLPLHSFQQQQQHTQIQGHTQILHMTFQPVSPTQGHVQQMPVLANPQQLQPLQTVPHTSSAPNPTLLLPRPQTTQDSASTNGESYDVLDGSALIPSASPSLDTLQVEETMDEVGGVWDQGGEGVILTDGTEGQMQHTLI